jgi:MFS family permease
MLRKNLLLLATCQGLMLSSTSLTMATSALVGASLAPDAAMITLPLGLTYLSMMLTMIPGSLLMKRYGRRTGFTLGGIAGTLGGVVSAVGIYEDSFALFCLGSGLFGVANGFAQFYRFAATEVAEPAYKSRAISWVLAGGLVAAFVGPNVARATRELIPDAVFSASYACIAIFCLCVVVVQVFLRVPRPSLEEKSGRRRPLTFVLTRPIFIVAALCAMIAYGTMNLLMTATPLAMDTRNLPFGDTALVIQWHIVGMFAPSFFTGHLIHRYGVLKVMFVGALLLLGCALISLLGQSYNHFFIALILLGVGWNFLFVGGTTLLTEVYLPAEKGAVQGINDFLVFSATAFTALTSGYFHFVLGWEKLNLYAIPVVCFAALIIIVVGIHTRSYKIQAT